MRDWNAATAPEAWFHGETGSPSNPLFIHPYLGIMVDLIQQALVRHGNGTGMLIVLPVVLGLLKVLDEEPIAGWLIIVPGMIDFGMAVFAVLAFIVAYVMVFTGKGGY